MSERYFRHIDGGLYRFVAHARHADDAGEVVIYEHLWPFDQSLWVRKRDEFETRFKPVEAAVVHQAMKQDRAQAQAQVTQAKTARRAAKQE